MAKIPSAQHNEYCISLIEHGGVMDRIAPAEFEGRGTGMVATHYIPEGTMILHVPRRFVIDFNTIPALLRPAAYNISLHGQIAALFAIDCKVSFPSLALWRSTLPRREDLTSSALYWGDDVVDKLPPGALKRYWEHRRAYEGDYEKAKEAVKRFTDLDYDEYLYYWILVNSRAMYQITEESLFEASSRDCIAMCPFLDYFNHENVSGVNVMYNTDVGVSITADKNYVPGEEIYLCYGKLNNDFLMIDYGFTLDDNRYDTVWLNTVVLDHTTVGDKWRLVDKFLHGRYVLDREAVCYRTYATVRLLVEDYENWKEWVDGTRDDTELMNPEVHEKLVDILRLQLTRGAQKRKKLKLAARTEPEAAACVDRRWQQTVDMLKEAIIKYSPGGHVVAYPKPIPKKFDFGPQLDLISLEGQANPKAMMPRRR